MRCESDVQAQVAAATCENPSRLSQANLVPPFPPRSVGVSNASHSAPPLGENFADASLGEGGSSSHSQGVCVGADDGGGVGARVGYGERHVRAKQRPLAQSADWSQIASSEQLRHDPPPQSTSVITTQRNRAQIDSAMLQDACASERAPVSSPFKRPSIQVTSVGIGLGAGTGSTLGLGAGI